MKESSFMPEPENVIETDQEKITKLENLIRRKLDIMSPAVAGRFGDEDFSFDAASYYTLVKMSNGEVKPIKLGWGEMSRRTFEADKEDLPYPDTNGLIREIPLPMYCLAQRDSFLADEKDVQRFSEKPVEYITDKARFVFDKGEIGFRGRKRVEEGPRQTALDLSELKVIGIDEAIEKMESFAS